MLAAFLTLTMVAQEPSLSKSLAQQPELTIAEELDALIARANALTSFQATYRGRMGDAEFLLELSYQAPDRAFLHFARPGATSDWWCVEGTSLFHSVTPEEDAWARFDAPRPGPSHEALELLFPGDQRRIGPGVFFNILPPEQSRPGGLNLLLDYRLDERFGLFNWLSELRHHDLPEVERTERSLVSKRSGAVVRANGMLESVELCVEPRVVLGLGQFRGGLALEPALFRWPAEGDSAPRDEKQRERVYQQRYGPLSVRATAFARVEGALASGKLTWSERVQSDWGALSTTLHTERCEAYLLDWKAQLAKHVEGLELRDATPEWRSQARSELIAAMGDYLEDYLTKLPEVGTEGRRPREELFQAERLAFGRLFDSLVRQPTLALFDGRTKDSPR